MLRQPPHSIAVGLGAALAAAMITAGWQVATRAGVTTSLGPLDLAVLRYGVPALVLAPLLLRHGLWPAATPRWLFLPIFLGAGLPFGLLAMSGAVLAPVAHMGALMPGTMPMFTGLLAAALLGERINRLRLAGFALIAAGVIGVSGRALADLSDETWIGDALFLGASLAWAVYTVAFRKSGLTPWHSTALLSLASAVAVLPLWLWAVGPARLIAAPWTDLAGQILAQGVFAGLGGMWVYAVAIRRLGAPRAALSGALVPALAALGGVVALGEVPPPLSLGGVAVIILGVVVASMRARA
jgi:drug/metabolite transporter (DMT)-like permease